MGPLPGTVRAAVNKKSIIARKYRAAYSEFTNARGGGIRGLRNARSPPVLRAFRARPVALNARNPRPPRVSTVSTSTRERKRGRKEGGKMEFLLLSTRRVIIRGEWTISGAAAAPLV